MGVSLPFLFIAPNPLILASAFRWSAACHALAAWWQHRPLAASCHWYFGRVTTQSHMIFTSALFRQRNFTCGALPHAPHSPCCRTPILRSCPRSLTSATGAAEKCPVSVWVSKTIKEIAEEIGVSKQAVFKKMKREPLSTGLQGLTVKTAFMRYWKGSCKRRISNTTDSSLSDSQQFNIKLIQAL